MSNQRFFASDVASRPSFFELSVVENGGKYRKCRESVKSERIRLRSSSALRSWPSNRWKAAKLSQVTRRCEIRLRLRSPLRRFVLRPPRFNRKFRRWHEDVNLLQIRSQIKKNLFSILPVSRVFFLLLRTVCFCVTYVIFATDLIFKCAKFWPH